MIGPEAFSFRIVGMETDVFTAKVRTIEERSLNGCPVLTCVFFDG